MNTEEWKQMLERIGIKDLEMVQRTSDYMAKAENAEILWCEDHDREWFDFESPQCPMCMQEEKEFKEEMEGRA